MNSPYICFEHISYDTIRDLLTYNPTLIYSMYRAKHLITPLLMDIKNDLLPTAKSIKMHLQRSPLEITMFIRRSADNYKKNTL